MNVPFELHIAFRYLVAKRKQAFISVISFISTLGVTVGVMALVIALALMTGLMQEVRDRILASNPHVYVWKRGGITDYRAEADRLRQMPRVLGAAPAILDQTLVFGRGISSPIQIKGIDPAHRAGGHRYPRRDPQRQPGRSGERRRSSAGRPARQAAGGQDGRLGRRPRQRHLARAGADRARSPSASAARRRHVRAWPAGVRLDIRLHGHRGREAPVRQDRHRLHPAARRRHLGRARDCRPHPRQRRGRLPDGGLGRHEPVAVQRAVPRAQGHLARHRA